MQPYTQSVCILTRCCQSICPRQDGSVQGDRTHLRLYTASLWCAPSAHAIGTTSLNEISLLFSFQFKLGHIPSTNRFLRPFESKMCDSCGETFAPFRDRVCQMLWNTVLTDFQILNARLPLKFITLKGYREPWQWCVCVFMCVRVCVCVWLRVATVSEVIQTLLHVNHHARGSLWDWSALWFFTNFTKSRKKKKEYEGRAKQPQQTTRGRKQTRGQIGWHFKRYFNRCSIQSDDGQQF